MRLASFVARHNTIKNIEKLPEILQRLEQCPAAVDTLLLYTFLARPLEES